MEKIPMVEVPPDILIHSQVYLYHRYRHLAEKKDFDAASRDVKDWLGKQEEDYAGNKVYAFPEPLSVADGKTYSGVMLRKTTGLPSFQTDEVLEFAKKRDLLDRMIEWTPAVNEEEVYVLYQEGMITEDELRSLLHYPKPSYSLWPVEYKAPLEEEA
jgi:hypothetical protein